MLILFAKEHSEYFAKLYICFVFMRSVAESKLNNNSIEIFFLLDITSKNSYGYYYYFEQQKLTYFYLKEK